MSAMAHARQMELVLESLGAGKKEPTPEILAQQPQWRLVAEDGSTSSVAGPSKGMSHDCPDCLAGRCGQNPEGCQCSSDGSQKTIALEDITGVGSSRDRSPYSTTLGGHNAAMPQAKPQLFNRPATSFLETPPRDQDRFVVRATARPQQVSAKAPSKPEPVKQELPIVPSPSPQDEELQQVIRHWPHLPHVTRLAILAILKSSAEADRA